jgi:hypothetical protein
MFNESTVLLLDRNLEMMGMTQSTLSNLTTKRHGNFQSTYRTAGETKYNVYDWEKNELMLVKNLDMLLTSSWRQELRTVDGYFSLMPQEELESHHSLPYC